MEPIAELEDDEEGFDYDSPGGLNSMNDSRNMMGFRSRSNTWPQFSSLAYEDAGGEQADDDTHELTDKADPLCQPPYSLYESAYHKGLHGLESETTLYSNHLHGPGAEYTSPGSHSELTSTSTPTNLSLHKANPAAAAYYQSATASAASSLTRASNHFSSRNDDLDTGSPPEPTGLINGAHSQQQQQQQHNLLGGESGLSALTGALNSSSSSGSGTGSALGPAAVASALKKNTSRRNAWGNMSYADLITQAINGSPDKRLTLSQIYEWMVQNVSYFKDKGDSNSSAGWKNSIRHNLSLHNRFMRVQNEGTGKSSWWMINPDAKPGKAARRRAISMETHNYEKRRGRVKRRVEQLRAAGLCGGHDPSLLAPLSEYPLKSSEPSLLASLSSSSGSSSYKLTGSTGSLLSPQTSLSSLCLNEAGSTGGQSNPHLVASPSSTDSYDPFSDSAVVNHFHSSQSNYSPSEFRPRASSNASSTCSTVNLLIDNDNHQVPSLSPHNWTTDMRLYNSAGNSFSSGLDQTGGGGGTGGPTGYRTSANELQLIDCLANLATGPSHNYRMIVEDEAELLHNKNNNSGQQQQQQQPVHAPSGGAQDTRSSPHADMMMLGADMPGHGVGSSHSYNDLYKLQPQSQQQQQHGQQQQTSSVSPSTSSPPSTSSSKLCFTSLDSAPERKANTGPSNTGSFFKSPSSSLIEGILPVSTSTTAGGKVHEINNNNSASSSAASLYESTYHRYGGEHHHRSASLANLAAYQHSQQHHPGKMTLSGFMYSPDPAQCYSSYGGNEPSPFASYYDYPGVHPHEALTHYASQVASGHDIDLDFDTVCASQSGMLECDVDQVIRHELSVDGSLDFGLTTTGTNADSTTSSTSTTPTTTSCSQNTYPMHTTETSQARAEAAHSPSQATSMDISYGESHPSPYYATLTSANSASGAHAAAAAANSKQQQPASNSSSSPAQPIVDNPLPTQSPAPLGSHSSSSVVPLRPSTVIYGPYSPSQYLASGHHHYLSVTNPTSATAVVVAAAAETAVSVSVTSPVTVSGHHQQPVASRSWVH